MGRSLDLPSWRRHAHYELFRAMPDPWFSLCAEVDVTGTWLASRRPEGPSFFLAALFQMLHAANETEALRLRLREDGVWLHERIHASSTILRPDETFGFAEFRMTDRYPEFDARGRAETARVKREGTIVVQEGRDDLVYHSSLPWIRFTAFSNPREANLSIPRIVFGRCTEVGSRWRMPVAVEVHHALVDGLDVARFLERLEAGLAPEPAWAAPSEHDH